ncbi:MAG: hypothetical protein L0Y66_11835 [Myxococcaceae bacterium]|nr:hypothetical protein [Myxococcaceae bacterium]
MNRNLAMTLGALVLGCAAGMTLDSRAQAQAFTTPAVYTRWQQFCEASENKANAISAIVRAKGDEGWELASVSIGTIGGSIEFATVCFKRPVR